MSPPKILKIMIISAAVLLAAFWALPSWAETYSNGEARISYLEGEVLLKNAETEDWVEVSKNLPVKADDNLWVPAAGKAEIKFSEGSVVRLSENTALAMGKLERTETGARTELVLTEGTATFVARAPYKGGMEFLVDTPNLTARASEQATFRLDLDQQGASTLTVHKGTVEATTSEGTVEMGQGQAARFAEGKMASQEQYAKDDWDRWSERRDATYASGKSRKYLPPSMASEAADFDNNGRWIYTEDYGYVWVPNDADSADWSPYSDGRWVYVGPDMVWLPYESWGWAPFHFGRWVFLPVGWTWVPPLRGPFPFWLPAAVTWFTVGDLFCWAPLAPGEFFFGWRVFGPGCFRWGDPFFRVHVVNIFVFKNVLVRNGVCAFSRSAVFVSHPRRLFVSAAVLRSGHIGLGDPKIRVHRAAFDPHPGKIVSHKALPSGSVLHHAAVTKQKGWERVSSAQRHTALTKPPQTIKGKTPLMRAPNTRPQLKANTETGKPFKPGVENRGNFSRQAPLTKEFKGQPGVITQVPPPPSIQRPRSFSSGERTFSSPPRTSRGSSTWSSPSSVNRPGFGSRFGQGSSTSGSRNNLGRAGGFSPPSGANPSSTSSPGSSSGSRGGSQGGGHSRF